LGALACASMGVGRDSPCFRTLAGTVPRGSRIKMQATSEHTLHGVWHRAGRIVQSVTKEASGCMFSPAPCQGRDVEPGSPLLGRSAVECRLKPRHNIIPCHQHVVDIVPRGTQSHRIGEYLVPPG
jgi:hypothetical protein